MTPLVYLAEPIDQTTGPDLQTDRLCATLASEFNVYRPRTAWRAGGDLDPRLDRLNREALGQADVMVAHLPAGSRSIGVPMEIEYAAIHGIPVVVLTPTPSFALVGRDGIEIVGHIHSIPSLVRSATTRVRRDRYEQLGRDDVLRVSVMPGGRLPSRAYPDDAGLDLYVSEPDGVPAQWHLEPKATVDIPTGVRIQLPPWAWGEIVGRSSTLRNRGLQVQSGVIDAGWRGELFTQVINLTDQAVFVKSGERLAQLIIHDNATRRVVMFQVDELDPHDRGVNGFGSSGQ